MDGMLSQDEINALLNGMDLSQSSDTDTPDSAENTADTSGDMINSTETGSGAGDDKVLLTDVEKDAIGEVANISMGSSATTLYSLVSRKVNITTPVVTLANWETLLGDYERPCVFIQIKYTQGLDGSNILVLKEQDVKIIADLMMGGDGSNTDGELGELHLSAISEAMNQMMGSAATSLSTLLQTTIDISPPEASLLDLNMYEDGSEIEPFLGGTFVKIAFRMQIGDLVDSTIMQLYPIEFARRIVDTFMGSHTPEAHQAPVPENAQSGSAGAGAGNNGMGANPAGMENVPNGMGMNPAAVPAGMNTMGMNSMMMNGGMNPMGMDQSGMYAGGMNAMGMPAGMNGTGMNAMGMPAGMNGGMNPMMMNGGMSPMNMSSAGGMQSINVQPAQFQNFSNNAGNMQGQENIGLIMDVPLEVTVELGRTTKSISEILDFAPGTIIELDRIAGEPIDVLVNGKFVARGEVVVIEESFGVRVTEIIK